jgi:hypothetical protein
MKIEALKRGEDIGKEAAERKLFFFLWDEEEFCFLFLLRLSVLRPCKLLPPLKLTSVWIIGAFPVDIAVIWPFQNNEFSHKLRHSCWFLRVCSIVLLCNREEAVLCCFRAQSAIKTSP